MDTVKAVAMNETEIRDQAAGTPSQSIRRLEVGSKLTHCMYIHDHTLMHVDTMTTVHVTASPCTPVITSSSVTQANLVSPSTPHTSTPHTILTNTTPVNSASVAATPISTPQGTFVQPMDQTGPGSQLQLQAGPKLPFTPQQQQQLQQLQQLQQQASNGLYVQDASMAGVGGVAVGYVGLGGINLSSPQPVNVAGIDATGKGRSGVVGVAVAVNYKLSSAC